MQHAEPPGRRWLAALGFAFALAAVTGYYFFVSTGGRFDRWPDLRID
jgi:hypothetical protein